MHFYGPRISERFTWPHRICSLSSCFFFPLRTGTTNRMRTNGRHEKHESPGTKPYNLGGTQNRRAPVGTPNAHTRGPCPTTNENRGPREKQRAVATGERTYGGPLLKPGLLPRPATESARGREQTKRNSTRHAKNGTYYNSGTKPEKSTRTQPRSPRQDTHGEQKRHTDPKTERNTTNERNVGRLHIKTT